MTNNVVLLLFSILIKFRYLTIHNLLCKTIGWICIDNKAKWISVLYQRASEDIRIRSPI